MVQAFAILAIAAVAACARADNAYKVEFEVQLSAKERGTFVMEVGALHTWDAWTPALQCNLFFTAQTDDLPIARAFLGAKRSILCRFTQTGRHSARHGSRSWSNSIFSRASASFA